MNNGDFYGDKRKRWDAYFYNICCAVASKSPCLSVQRGAVLVKDKSVIATGYNGPARGIPHCGHPRYFKDENLASLVREKIGPDFHPTEVQKTCPRHLLGYLSGEGLEICIATHAEANCIANAARVGVCTYGSTLYLNCETPCKDCFSLLINAGVKEIVVMNLKHYDSTSFFIKENSKIKVRQFDLGG